MDTHIAVDPIACEAYGYCAELLPELVTLDEWGYPVVDAAPVPAQLVAMARHAARQCPRRAFLLRAAGAPPTATTIGSTRSTNRTARTS
jgi:ferredoxin